MVKLYKIFDSIEMDKIWSNNSFMNGNMKFIDLFAGAGGLSEGFLRAGFVPMAHVEIDKAACNTLKTRMARHWLYRNDKYKVYEQYLLKNISRQELWDYVPSEVIESVLNCEIGGDSNPEVFKKIDGIIKNNSQT